MKIPAIKKLIDNYTVQELNQADKDLVNGAAPAIEIDGDDEGEKLTHIFAAIWIHNYVIKHDVTPSAGLRAYTSMIRGSLS